MSVAAPPVPLRTNRQREWVIAAPHPLRQRLARDAGLSELLAQILLQRGVQSAGEIGPFLSPAFKDLLPPETLPGAAEAARRLVAAVRAGKRIVIYGDYDVDGITATTILWHCLRLAGADVRFYIPSRLEEGYGLNADALTALAADGAHVVITVDCGITAIEPVNNGKAQGLEIIITDHHQPGPQLPAADTLVHPTALGDSPNPHLSGAGVALKVAWAIAREMSAAARVTTELRNFLIDATAFAALGLIADVVPLVGENRIIASYGLRQLCHTQNIGLQALIEIAGLGNKRQYDDYDVGFKLAPRLNAIGRLGHARLAVDLFTRADADQAQQIASLLDRENRKRQEVERQITDQAEELVSSRGFDREGCRGIVLASPQWHAGVVGIVASRLVERFGRPTVLIALENGKGQGSGRSIRHFPLHEVLTACGEHLLSHGGHAMAAGVTLRTEKVDAFTEAFQAQAAQRLTPRDLVPKLHLDDEVALGELSLEVVGTLERLAPFGEGNPRPRLATPAVEVVDEPRAVGRTASHLQFTVRQGATYRKVIAFGRGAEIEQLAAHRAVRLAFEPLISEWNGNRRVELKALDWQPVA